MYFIKPLETALATIKNGPTTSDAMDLVEKLKEEVLLRDTINHSV